ncbi:MAG: FimV/HubP family polar landmark protein [Burkholderiaceae bacterium]
MPSQKFARAPLWCALSLALGLAVSSPGADAAGLGRLTVQSGLGQPLKAELEVTAVGRDELPTLQVKLAPLAAFRAANLEFNPALSNLRFALEKRADGTYFVRIASPQPVNEPYIDLMVELTWSTGRVIREYTVLLDPPSLRQQAEVVPPAAPVASAPAPVVAPSRPAPAASTPAPAPATPASPAQAPAPVAKAAPTPMEGSYTVKSGDTLGKIAAQNKPGSVSLDQMLVAMFRQNPDAFVGNNMNRLKAGVQIAIPSESDAAAVTAGEARQEVVAQSADFAQYKSRLAQAAASAPVAAAAPAAAAGGGQVTTRVEEKGAPAQPAGDQLKIAKAEDKGAAAAAAAAAKADEAAAKQRALKEEQEKAEQLKKTNEAIKKALEVQSKSGAQVQKQAEKTEPAPAAAAPAQPAKAEAPKAEVPKAEPAKTDAPPAAAAPAPAPKAAAPAPAPTPQEESNVFVDMLGNTTTQLGLAGIVVLLGGLFGWSWLRKRKTETGDRFKETGEGLQANSLFGATGGQSVDTGTSTFNSSFIPAASQLDSNEVDPVAEADVYIAYGREEQAEDILKEALRLQPDRHAVRVKLLEIYARRGDQATFMTICQDLKERTGGVGEDWEKAIRLGKTIDPSNPMFAGADMGRGPATGFRLDPNTKSGRPSTLGGGPTTGLDLSGLTANSVLSQDATSSAPPLTRMVVDTRMSDTAMSGMDTKMPGDTRLSPATTSGPTTQFQATFTGGAEGKNTISAPTSPATDFGSLDFDLGPTKINLGPTTKMPDTTSGSKDNEDDFAATAPRKELPAVADIDSALEAKYPAMPPTATGVGLIPDLDLNIPHTRMPVPPPAPEARPILAEALSRPTVIGAMKGPGVNTMMASGLPDDAAARLTANTDQATVPLIDFDLSAVSLDAATKRGETEPGSALAQQMATKLDLARGYIDLGVKDGARELLDEVMRDGTRDQRQSAVELIKQIEN